MRVSYFQQVPYRHLGDDFAEQYPESVVSTPYFEVTEADHVRSAFRDALDECMHAARAGLDALALTEHSQSSYDMSPNPDLLAAALAYLTEVEGLPCGIYPVGRSLGKSREPLRVAEEQAMLDCIGGGRLICGFPVGPSYDANINNGVPPIETRARFEENLELVLRAWSDTEPFAFNGKFNQFRQVNIWPRPLQGSPPVWLTGIGDPQTTELALRRGFGFNYSSWFGIRLTGPRIFSRFWEAADRLGIERNPYRLGFLQTVCVAETDAKAERRFARHIEYFFHNALGGIPIQRLMLPGGMPVDGLEALLRDPAELGMWSRLHQAGYRELIENGAVVCGSPATVRDALISAAREHHIGVLHVALQFGSMPTMIARENIDLFAAEVLPGLRGIWDDLDWRQEWWPARLGGTPVGRILQAAGR